MRGYSSCVRVSLVGIKPNSGDVLLVENWQDSPQGEQRNNEPAVWHFITFGEFY